MADSHSALAAKIEVDVEQPLREFTSANREMQNMSTIQGNLAAMAKDVEKAKQKVEKLQSRGETGKVAGANSELDTAEAQWESQAPYVFENLQAVDEARLNRLRDVLTQYQTHEVDLVQKSQTTAEHCLNVLLSLQTEDEIKTFAIKAVQGRPQVERQQRTSVPSAPIPSRTATASSSGLAPTISQQDDSSMRSGSMQEDTKKKSRFGALKRLGTVAGGRKNRESKQPSQLAPMSESPERKSRSPFNSLGNRFGKLKGMTELEPPLETPTRERPRSPLRQGSEMFQPNNYAEQVSPAPAQRYEAPPRVNGTGASSSLGSAPFLPTPAANGSHQGDLAGLEPPKPVQPEPQAPLETQRDAEGYSMPPRELDPISQAQADAAAASEGAAPAFNVNIRNAPIADDAGDHQAALASMASALQPPPFVASKLGTVRGRRNRPTSMMPGPQEQPSSLHSSAFVPPPRSSSATNARTERSGFAEEPQEVAEAPRNGTIDSQPRSNAFGGGPAGVGGFSPFASSTSQPPITEQPPSASPPMQTPPTASGTGGPADGSFAPSMSQPTEQARSASPAALSPTGTFGTGTPGGNSFSPFASTMSQAPSFRPDSRSAVGDHTGGDTGSIRSARSLTSTGSQGTKHPDLTEAGLSSSVIETVSARFETGKIMSSSLIGEIALAYNPTNTSSPSGTENIRLEHFASLEKVAPNPAFITQTPDKTGEYTLNLANLSKTQVAFKYQVRADDAGSQAPMLIAPAFKIEPTQASIIVSYSLNSAFNLHGRDSITLSNVMLALTLEGARATGCQSRPVGTFSRERNLIFWPLGDVTLKAGAAPEKLLARFATESEASSGSVEVRWEITGENAIGLGSGLSISVQGQAGGSTEDDPFADDDAVGGLTAVWKGVVGMKKLASGAYTAK
ncbi:Suppressor of Profilin deletion [Elasticomyces elasticus]|nr:Suppressor of Profilin deletion [Elasticomyces elasticus]KAK4974540.1 Suppressor of Profilin deletion [Elasticomyces elasticus]